MCRHKADLSQQRVTSIPRLIYGRLTSGVYNHIQYLRDTLVWWEDLTVIKMGGPGHTIKGKNNVSLGCYNFESNKSCYDSHHTNENSG